VGNGNRVVYSDTQPKVTAVALRETSALSTPATSAVVRAAPLFGQGSLIYTVDQGGEVIAWNAGLNPQWSTDLGNLDIEASPTIDCTRDTVGAPIAGRPGVLYVASRTGTVDAIVVDSRGIDTTAPWPKYQHDPRNSGNSATPLTEFACP
jgi:hypothetical protein